MIRIRKPAALLVAGTIGVSGTFLWLARHNPFEKGSRPNEAVVDALPRPSGRTDRESTSPLVLAGLHQRIAELEQRLEDFSRDQLPSPDIDAEMDAEAAREEAAEEAEKHRFEALEQQITTEPIDTDWAWNVEHDIAERLARQEHASTQLVELTCGSALCKLDTRHDDPEGQDRFLSTIPWLTDHVERGVWRKVVGERGDLGTLVYLHRHNSASPDG